MYFKVHYLTDTIAIINVSFILISAVSVLQGWRYAVDVCRDDGWRAAVLWQLQGGRLPLRDGTSEQRHGFRHPCHFVKGYSAIDAAQQNRLIRVVP